MNQDKSEGKKSFLGKPLDYLVKGAKWVWDKTPTPVKVLGVGITTCVAGSYAPLNAQEIKSVESNPNNISKKEAPVKVEKPKPYNFETEEVEKKLNQYLKDAKGEQELLKILTQIDGVDGDHLITMNEANAWIEKQENKNNNEDTDILDFDLEEITKDEEQDLFSDDITLEEEKTSETDYSIRVKGGLNFKDNEGPVYGLDLLRSANSKEVMRLMGEITDIKRYLPGQEEPSDTRGTIVAFKHDLGWINYHIGIDSFRNLLNIKNSEFTSGDPLSITEINEENYDDISKNFWGGVDFSLGDNIFVIGYGKKDITENTEIENLTITEGDIWTEVSPGVWDWVHYYDDSRRTDSSEFKDNANILNLEYARELGINTKLFALGRAMKGETNFNLESILNGTSLNIDYPESEEYMRWLLGAGGKYLSEDFAGLSLIYGMNGDNVLEREKVGLQLSGAWRLNKNNTLGGSIFYHNSDPGASISYIYIPEGASMEKHSDFLKEHAYDMIPLKTLSSNGLYLINRSRYEDIVRKGGIALHAGSISQKTGERDQEDGDTIYTGGIGVGINNNIILDYIRLQDSISKEDSLGFIYKADSVPFSFLLRVSNKTTEYPEGEEESILYQAGLDFKF